LGARKVACFPGDKPPSFFIGMHPGRFDNPLNVPDALLSAIHPFHVPFLRSMANRTPPADASPEDSTATIGFDDRSLYTSTRACALPQGTVNEPGVREERDNYSIYAPACCSSRSSRYFAA